MNTNPKRGKRSVITLGYLATEKNKEQCLLSHCYPKYICFFSTQLEEVAIRNINVIAKTEVKHGYAYLHVLQPYQAYAYQDFANFNVTKLVFQS